MRTIPQRRKFYNAEKCLRTTTNQSKKCQTLNSTMPIDMMHHTTGVLLLLSERDQSKGCFDAYQPPDLFESCVFHRLKLYSVIRRMWQERLFCCQRMVQHLDKC